MRNIRDVQVVFKRGPPSRTHHCGRRKRRKEKTVSDIEHSEGGCFKAVVCQKCQMWPKIDPIPLGELMNSDLGPSLGLW